MNGPSSEHFSVTRYAWWKTPSELHLQCTGQRAHIIQHFKMAFVALPCRKTCLQQTTEHTLLQIIPRPLSAATKSVTNSVGTTAGNVDAVILTLRGEQHFKMFDSNCTLRHPFWWSTHGAKAVAVNANSDINVGGKDSQTKAVIEGPQHRVAFLPFPSLYN